MRKTATIIVKGDVCDLNYRTVVYSLAKNYSLCGYVEILPTFDVKIVCVGEETNIVDFAQAIKINNGIIKVEAVEMQLSDATTDFENFSIKFGDLLFETYIGFATVVKNISVSGKRFAHRLSETSEKILDAVSKNLDKSVFKFSKAAVESAAQRERAEARNLTRLIESIEKSTDKLASQINGLRNDIRHLSKLVDKLCKRQ